jgi:uracil-DNA glycosylase family 4
MHSLVELKRKPAEATTTFDPRKLGAKCDVCPLRGCKPVPSTIIDKPKFIIVGEAPGRIELREGANFLGPSGKLLDKHLSKAGLRRDDAAVLNSLLCRPEQEKDTPGAMLACSGRLFNELKQFSKSTPIFAMGGVATKALLGANSILRARGFIWNVDGLEEKEFERLKKKAAETSLADLIKKASKEKKQAKSKKQSESASRRKGKTVITPTGFMKVQRQCLQGRTVLPMLHPAFILRSEIWNSLLSTDMARAAKWLKLGKHFVLEDKRPFLVVDSASELRKAAKLLGNTVTVDIESDSPDALLCRLTCVGIGDTKRRIVAYPWRDSMAKVLSQVFTKRITIGHNLVCFDQMVLERYGVSFGWVEDTMVAHHAFASHLPKSLLHVASVYCDSSPWKHKAKGEGKTEKGLPHEQSPEDLVAYNAADIGLTALAWERMQPDLEAERSVYLIDMRMAQLCASMKLDGFRFDVDRARELGKILQGRKNALLGEMRKLTRMPYFSPSKPDDIRRALFGRFNSPLVKPTPTGLASTAKDILEQLRYGEDRAGRLSDLILRWREAAKTKSTYLSRFVHADGRVHEDWRIGPSSGRVACRMMTLPRYTPEKNGVVDAVNRVRECYIAAPGKVLVYWDLEQAEAKFAANISQDPKFMAACRKDIHAENAKIIFPEAAEQGWLDGPEAKKGKGKPFRDRVKSCGFAIFYLAVWETIYGKLIADGFEVSPADCRAIVDMIHDAYKVYFRFVDSNVEFVRRNGYLRTAGSGRIRWFGQYPEASEVANYPVQPGIADHMNERLPIVDDRLPRGAAVIAQIHDAAIVECWRKDEKLVSSLAHEVFDPPIELPDRDPFFVPIELKTAERWSDL